MPGKVRGIKGFRETVDSLEEDTNIKILLLMLRDIRDCGSLLWPRVITSLRFYQIQYLDSLVEMRLGSERSLR